MSSTMEEVVEYLEIWDIEPTKDNIAEVLKEWINNLYSHVGAEAHKHSLVSGVIDNTGMTWEEQDLQMLQQIGRYETCLEELK